VGLWSWLFGKRENPAAPAAEERPSSPLDASTNRPADNSGEKRPTTAPGDPVPERPAPKPVPAKQAPEALEAENLRRWQTTGQARAWVEARRGSWNHDDWLALLEELRRSSYWPLRPEEVGLALEDAKREWLRRN
jgi:hypothetical protein